MSEGPHSVSVSPPRRVRRGLGTLFYGRLTVGECRSLPNSIHRHPAAAHASRPDPAGPGSESPSVSVCAGAGRGTSCRVGPRHGANFRYTKASIGGSEYRVGAKRPSMVPPRRAHARAEFAAIDLMILWSYVCMLSDLISSTGLKYASVLVWSRCRARTASALTRRACEPTMTPPRD